MARLTDQQISQALDDLPGWERVGDAIEKRFVFASFADAVAFVVRLAFEAEAADHHPEISISYRRVMLSYSTHSEGGLTTRDIDAAAKANAVFDQRYP
jgi:4a-hydroxytetrahydrobiopterin dehydratase